MRVADPRKIPWRLFWFGIGGAYVMLIFLHQFYSGFLYRHLPQPVLFFVQIAALFPHAKINDSESRMEGWVCAEGRFLELDSRPYFPIHSDNKESRFDRTLYFFRSNRKVLYALEDYIVTRHNRMELAPGRLGGVRFSTTRTPIPPPGGVPKRYRKRPLSEFPPDSIAVRMFTPMRMRMERCREDRP